MRDRKVPDDDYNKQLHIYAETPGIRLQNVVPSTEKELNIPTGGKKAESARNDELANPYARIPAQGITDDEEEGGVGPSTSKSGPKSSHTLLASRSVRTEPTSGIEVKQRDPIYAELSHRDTEDDRVERTGERRENTDGKTAAQRQKSGSNEKRPPETKSKNKNPPKRGEQSLPPSSSSSTAVTPSSSATNLGLLGNIRGRGEKAKTIHTHTRLDASLEIPATPRPKPIRPDAAKNNDDGGVLLIRKVERYPEEGRRSSDLDVTVTDGGDGRTIDVTGVTLKNLTRSDAHLSGTTGGAEVGTTTMPVDPDIDAGIAILKKKKRFRRNLVIIIAFLMVLLIVVAAVIISLVIITKGS